MNKINGNMICLNFILILFLSGERSVTYAYYKYIMIQLFFKNPCDYHVTPISIHDQAVVSKYLFYILKKIASIGKF